MLTRIWRGRTSAANADAYGDFLRRMAYPDYGGVAGNRGWLLLRREIDDTVEFAFVSFWDSIEALHAYAGDDAAQPHHYPEDLAALLPPLERADNYEILDVKLDL